MISKGAWIRQLCLHCARIRLGRDLTPEDFIDCYGFNGNHKTTNGVLAYRRKAAAYANSGKNTSRVW